MVRFSCFNAHSHKPKRAVEHSVEAMHKTLQDSFQFQVSKMSPKATSLNSLFLNAQANTQIDDNGKDVTSSVSTGRGWDSKELKGELKMNGDIGDHQTGLLKKSQSLGSDLCHECSNDTEDEIDHGFSCDSVNQNWSIVPHGSKDPGVSPTNQHQNVQQSESVHANFDLVNNESIFSVGDPQNSEKEGHENSDVLLSGEGANVSGTHTPHARIVKSCSLPNIGPSTPTSGDGSYKYLAPHSRSSEDLRILERKWKEISIHEVEMQEMQHQERDGKICVTERNNYENSVDDDHDSCNYSAMTKDWIVPVTEYVNLKKHLQGESSSQHWNSLARKDFKIKRIEEWVNDLQHCGPLEETNELPDVNNLVNGDSMVFNSLTAAKVASKVNPGMEAVKRYISSLGASATVAQLSNHGLAVIPFLGAFVSLRVLNLSGNSIERITAGALPRGLHMLNLSKNNISTIEGLRDLTRLRVLDLSYNRIFRIGHGLASCSSLKELYLAGNKISEVEGLHRLLKLTVLDLRFNKISTAKCLGQLAANYNSLQAISLEGNPAQKNVGDDQIKKYLLGLLPHLVYFNRQPIKVSTLKDVSDRSVRLGISAHQFDHGIRSDNKAARKASRGVASSRPSSSSIHGRKSQAVISTKQTRVRHVRPPPSGTKATTNHRHHYFDIGSKLFSFTSDLAIRRSRSEGTLGVL